MPQLTKRQHYVPEFYLSQWASTSGQITCHSLAEHRTFACAPAKALVQSYFYEEDPLQPDNRIERILAEMEGTSSVTFNKLITSRQISSGDMSKDAGAIQTIFTNEDADNLCDFAAYQYLRVPGAIDQKAYESQRSNLCEAEYARALNPGRFVESGYAYIKDRFRTMKLSIFVSPGREFLTSDWPCFDMKDSNDSPLLGEEIGQNSSVVCYLPISPHLAVAFYSPSLIPEAARARRVTTKAITDREVRNQNTLVIQQADRYVVASKEESFIFKIAAKRKKAQRGTNDSTVT